MKRTLTIGILAAMALMSAGQAQQENYTEDPRSADDKKLDLEIDTNVAKTPAQIQAKIELLHAEIMVNRMRIEEPRRRGSESGKWCFSGDTID